MVLGLLPAIRGGLGELAQTGQHTRLIDGYLTPYARAFDEVLYFSYLAESLGAYTTDRDLAARVRLLPGGRWHPWAYGFVMLLRYAREFRRCSVLRVFQITGAMPAVIAKRRFGVPFVTTYGFWYGRLARSRVRGSLRRVVEALGLRAADAVIVTTPELGAHVAARVGAAKVHLIPNGVDTTRFTLAPRSPRRVKNVLYVGRLSEEKNLSAVVEAAARLTSCGSRSLERGLPGRASRRKRAAGASPRCSSQLSSTGGSPFISPTPTRSFCRLSPRGTPRCCWRR
jgi:glycosyltransferase involved in cell wall biosynthesis